MQQLAFIKRWLKNMVKNIRKWHRNLLIKSKGKKIGNVNEALAAFEKYKDVLNKKFSKADRDAIF